MRGLTQSICLWACSLSAILLASQAHSTPWWEACRQTVLDYAYYRDRPDADGVAALFTDDATFTLGADKFVGREAIRARIQAGVQGPVFRHMMSTIKIMPVNEREARGVSYAAVYSGAAGPLPVVVADFLALGEYHDEFVRQGKACKIRSREFVQVIVPAD